MEHEVKLFFTQDESSSYCCHEVEFCNGDEPWPFSAAYVRSRPVKDEIGVLHGFSLMKMFPDAFKMLIPDDESGIALNSKLDVVKEQGDALQCLVTFLKDFKEDQDGINAARLKKRGNQTDICAVLAVHLFSKLISGKEVILNDKRMKGSEKKCPCKCRLPVPSGCTGVGHRKIWHGDMDILVKHTAVALIESTVDTDEDSDTESSECEDQEVVEKKAKFMEDPFLYYSTELKRKDLDVYRYDFGMQLIAQTLTNGFAQKSRLKTPNQLIPTVGGTVEDLLVYLYDPDQDILFRRTKKMSLFGDDNKLLLPTIVELWFVLNLHHFGSSLSKDVVSEVSKCGFKKMMEKQGALEYYMNLNVATEVQGRCPTQDFSRQLESRHFRLHAVPSSGV